MGVCCVQTPPWMPGLVGHTFTYVGDNKLVLIGGFSPHHYFSNNVYVYDADSVLMNWQEVLPETMSGAYPIGQLLHQAHSLFPCRSSNINTISVYGAVLAYECVCVLLIGVCVYYLLLCTHVLSCECWCV